MARRVLIAGESWTTHSIHQKGFDSFTTTEYQEGVGWLKRALEAAGWDVHYMPSHVAARDFPTTADALAAYGCVMLSDIGANTLLLHPDTFVRSRQLPNRLAALRDYTAAGGGLVMIGGYLTFQGIDAKAQYAGTPVEEALPVTFSRFDDRAETPQGATPRLTAPDHPIIAGVPQGWPDLLGYNRAAARPDADVIARIGDDPLLAVHHFGEGRGVTFASDCGPHWAPPAFVEWDGYAALWNGIAEWAAGLR